jgi:hypothetical protein
MSANFLSRVPSVPDEDERQLCLNCLSPNSPLANFCADCGAPLSSYAATGPLERVFAEGHVYRRAVAEPKSLLVVIGVWVLFGMTVTAGIMPFLLTPDDAGVPGLLMALLLVPISVAVIWKTTRRYTSRKVPSKEESA